MNKHISRITLLALVSGMVVLGACEKIDPADRLIPVDPSELPQTDRNVLVVEFTGQMCTNCPTGAQTIHNLMDVNPGKIIPVSMHPEGIYFTTWNYNRGKVDLTCSLANEYYAYFGNPSSFPCISTDFGSLNDVIASWGDNILTELKESTTVDFNYILTEYAEESRTLTVNYDIEALQYVADGAAVVFWIVENGLVGGQIDNGRPVYSYVHNHVLRGALTDTWGDPISGGLKPEQHLSGEIQYVLADTWKAENCEVIGFVLSQGKRVLQAKSAPVVGDTDSPSED